MRSSKPYSKPALREPMLQSDSHPGPFALHAHSLCSRFCTDLAQHFFSFFDRLCGSSSVDGEWPRQLTQGLGKVPECRFHGLDVPKASHANLTALCHSSGAPVSKTGRRAREAPCAARHGAHQPCVRRAPPAAVDIPVEQTASAWPCSHATAHGTRSRRHMGRWDDVVDRVRCARGRRTGALMRPGPDPQPTVAVVRIQGWMRHS